jgi:hypothetical protein
MPPKRRKIGLAVLLADQGSLGADLDEVFMTISLFCCRAAGYRTCN